MSDFGTWAWKADRHLREAEYHLDRGANHDDPEERAWHLGLAREELRRADADRRASERLDHGSEW